MCDIKFATNKSMITKCSGSLKPSLPQNVRSPNNSFVDPTQSKNSKHFSRLNKPPT